MSELRGQKILVTGGLGFVGHNLVKTLANKHGADVTVVDNCENSSEDAIKDVRDKVSFVKASVLDTDFLDTVGNYDYVYHLACIQIAHSAKDPVTDMFVNAKSTLEMLERLRYNENRKTKKFIYTSSASVYGNSQNFPCTETGATKVLSHYAATKLLGEQYTLMYNNLYGVPTSSVRYSNVYGFGQSPNNPYCGVIGKFIHNSLINEPVAIYGDGEQTRDYTFIDDAVAATILVGTSQKSLGEVYNVGTGKETTVNELCEIVRKLSNNVPVEYMKERSIDNIRRRCMNIDKLYNELGWSPEINLETGLKHTIDWYRDYIKA